MVWHWSTKFYIGYSTTYSSGSIINKLILGFILSACFTLVNSIIYQKITYSEILITSVELLNRINHVNEKVLNWSILVENDAGKQDQYFASTSSCELNGNIDVYCSQHLQNVLWRETNRLFIRFVKLLHILVKTRQYLNVYHSTNICQKFLKKRHLKA
jgi:hypothetical protein